MAVITVNIRFQGQSFPMKLYEDVTIKHLKSKITTRIHKELSIYIPSSQQLLEFKKRTLWHDENTLKKYKIKNLSIITVLVWPSTKIKQLRYQYRFTKSVDRMYKNLNSEFKRLNISETDLRSEIGAAYLWKLGMELKPDWKTLDKWISDKLRLHLYEMQNKFIMHKLQEIEIHSKSFLIVSGFLREMNDNKDISNLNYIWSLIYISYNDYKDTLMVDRKYSYSPAILESKTREIEELSYSKSDGSKKGELSVTMSGSPGPGAINILNRKKSGEVSMTLSSVKMGHNYPTPKNVNAQSETQHIYPTPQRLSVEGNGSSVNHHYPTPKG